MTRPGTGDWAVVLAELHAFFETCGEEVDDALAARFGFPAAVDWISAGLELVTEHLQQQPSPANSRKDQHD
ncbi:hypothetical protein [Streptomyces europaeiscabiei]|uniref:hypothetical protein n=1 Tax=Streptomyces europaeiscabiei TaxID=146819 RepID=UPI002E26BC72|nr:hypothetical protein OG858_00560 [Streptomyces europaeiscabiei]WUD38086.1 hypothetical protein OG858_46325 [Streptomyces europaeiscabiei]